MSLFLSYINRMAKREIVLILDSVRSAHNVGSLLRTADGLGVKHVYICGASPYPPAAGDRRLPHIQARVGRRIDKTALGAGSSVKWSYHRQSILVIKRLKAEGYHLLALEQTSSAKTLPDFRPPAKSALIAGNEVGGLAANLLALADTHLQIPMLGKKESYNVAVAGAIALYHLRFGR